MAYIGKSPSTGIRNRFIYTATSGQATFSGTDDHNRTLSYTDAEFTDVFLNGVKLDKSDYTATSGTSIVLDEAAAAGDTLEVLNFDTFSVFSGEFSQDVTIGGATTLSGDLTVDTNTLYVDSTNNRVGIGTSSPSVKLDIADVSANSNILLRRNLVATGAGLYQGEVGFGSYTTGTTVGYSSAIRGFSGNAHSSTNSSGEMVFYTTPSGSTTLAERMRIDSSGNVGINTSSPSDLLHLYKFQSDVGMRLQGSNASFYIENNYTQDALSFTRNTSEFMRLENDADLHVDGNVVAYSTTISDIRLKKDIAPIEDAVTKVQQLNGCTFTYLKDDRQSAGLIAQDVEKVLPSAVIEDEAVFHGEEGETYKTVQYDQLIGLLVEAVKELKAEIEELKNGTSN